MNYGLLASIVQLIILVTFYLSLIQKMGFQEIYDCIYIYIIYIISRENKELIQDIWIWYISSNYII